MFLVFTLELSQIKHNHLFYRTGRFFKLVKTFVEFSITLHCQILIMSTKYYKTFLERADRNNSWSKLMVWEF